VGLCDRRQITVGAIVEVARIWELAGKWYGDRLDVDWRRLTIPERQAILDAVGLRGQFWRLTAP